MVNLDWLINPILQNWVVLSITIIVTLLAAAISNWGIKKSIESGKQKDRQRALENLRTILENQIINNREVLIQDNPNVDEMGLSPERIEDLIHAAEREYQVSLSVSPTTLLQDVDLRIKDSRHLDPDQKNQYSAAIGKIIDKIREQDEKSVIITQEGAEALNRIKENANYTGYEKDIELLRESMITSEPSSPTIESEALRRALVPIIAGLAGFVTFTIGARVPFVVSHRLPLLIIFTGFTWIVLMGYAYARSTS